MVGAKKKKAVDNEHYKNKVLVQGKEDTEYIETILKNIIYMARTYGNKYSEEEKKSMQDFLKKIIEIEVVNGPEAKKHEIQKTIDSIIKDTSDEHKGKNNFKRFHDTMKKIRIIHKKTISNEIYAKKHVSSKFKNIFSEKNIKNFLNADKAAKKNITRQYPDENNKEHEKNQYTQNPSEKTRKLDFTTELAAKIAALPKEALLENTKNFGAMEHVKFAHKNVTGQSYDRNNKESEKKQHEKNPLEQFRKPDFTAELTAKLATLRKKPPLENSKNKESDKKQYALDPLEKIKRPELTALQEELFIDKSANISSNIIDRLISYKNIEAHNNEKNINKNNKMNEIGAAIIYFIPPQKIIDQMVKKIKEEKESESTKVIKDCTDLIASIKNTHPGAFEKCDLSQMKQIPNNEQLIKLVSDQPMNLKIEPNSSIKLSGSFGLSRYIQGDMSDLSPQEAAKIFSKELFLANAKDFCAMDPIELIHKIEKGKEETRYPAIEKLTASSNNLTNQSIQDILDSKDINKQQKVYSFYVNLMKDCYDNNDFKSAMALCAVFNSSSIHRLTYLGEESEKKIISDYSALLTGRNHKEIREKIDNLRDQPHIPFMGMYQTDLTFIKDGNPNDNDGLNLKKIQYSGGVLSKIINAQKVLSSLKEVSQYKDSPNITRFEKIGDDKTIDDDSRYAQSLEIFPRGSKQPFPNQKPVSNLKKNPILNLLQRVKDTKASTGNAANAKNPENNTLNTPKKNKP